MYKAAFISTVIFVFFCKAQQQSISFTPIQQDTFKDAGAQAIAWADYDNDGDLDVAVSFKDKPLRIYNNHNGNFTNVAADIGFYNKSIDTRALSWGDYNKDGWLDLFVGYGRHTGKYNTLYKNTKGKFTDVAKAVGIKTIGTTRQSSWIDYDNDGDSDLYISMRAKGNVLYRNDKGTFTNVSQSTNMADPRRTVASVWFDFDKDGDLDIFLANQSGDRDGFYRNDNGVFTDIAAQLHMDFPRRPLKEGSVGVSVADYDNDGDLDIFVGTYGTDVLYQNNGKGQFKNVAKALGVDAKDKVVGVDWGDYDNDGWQDLYVVGYKLGIEKGYDKLYHQENGKFVNLLPETLAQQDGDHGVRWADFDDDGDLDIMIANRHKDGQHQLFRNNLKKSKATKAIKVLVLDKNGHYTKQGSEIRVYNSLTKKLLATRLVDTGGGYVSQNVMPVHIGLGSVDVVDVKITYMTPKGRQFKTITNVKTTVKKAKTITVKI